MLKGLSGAGVKSNGRVPGGSRDIFLPVDGGGGESLDTVRGGGGVVVLPLQNGANQIKMDG